MRRKTVALLVCLCLAVLPALGGCAARLQLAGLALANSTTVLAPGQTARLALTHHFSAEAPNEAQVAAALNEARLAWASSDAAVATVDDTGLVTAVGPGSAEISVADEAGLHSAALAVTVVVPLAVATAREDVVLDLLAFETARVKVAVQPADATGVSVRYASGDETVARVNANGALAPVGAGETEVTTTVTGDGLDGPVRVVITTRVTVVLRPQGIALAQPAGQLTVGHTTSLAPYALPEEAGLETTCTFASGDEAVATVDAGGVVTALAAGACVITATSAEGHTAEYALTVVAARRGAGSGRATAGGTSAPGEYGEGPTGNAATGLTCWLCGVAWTDAHYGRCPVAIDMYNRGERIIDNGDGTFTPIAWLIYCDICDFSDGHTAENCPYRYRCTTCGYYGHLAENCTTVPYVCAHCGSTSSTGHVAPCPYAACEVCGATWLRGYHYEDCTHSGRIPG